MRRALMMSQPCVHGNGQGLNPRVIKQTVFQIKNSITGISLVNGGWTQRGNWHEFAAKCNLSERTLARQLPLWVSVTTGQTFCAGSQWVVLCSSQNRVRTHTKNVTNCNVNFRSCFVQTRIWLSFLISSFCTGCF